jgi:PhoH-like ATPase
MQPSKAMPAKQFILDTNVILHDPECFYKFQENTIILLPTVIAELDKIKSQKSSIGAFARQAHRNLHKIFTNAQPLEGATLPQGGIIKMHIDTASKNKAVETYPETTPDNLILHATCHIRDNSPKTTILITKDINLELKAKSIGIKVEDYKNDKAQVLPKTDIHNIKVNTNDHHQWNLSQPLPTNECLMAFHKDKPLGFFRHQGNNLFQPIPENTSATINSNIRVFPKNLRQRNFLHALLDANIPLVTCAAQAGTGKTYLAIAAGLAQTLGQDNTYQKIIIARPVISMGPEMGFLPGNMEEKMIPWLAGYHDNINQILRSQKPGKKTKKEPILSTGEKPGDTLIKSGIIEIQPLSYIRGRSLINTFIIVDETQNTTPHEVKTIVTRVGENSKVVLLGDPEQIDTPYLDAYTNGLSYLRDKTKDKSLCVHAHLDKGLRSKLAELAASCL